MKEIWKDIEGYEGLFQVSSNGVIRSLDFNHTGEIKLLKLQDNGKGYLRAHLYKNGETKKYMVHQLVAKAFLPNPNNYPIINHKDEDKTNNIIWVNDDGSIDYNKSNLEWCTHKYNINYGNRTKKANQSKCKKILQFDLEGNFIKLWDSLKSAEEFLKIKHSSIWSCLNGRYKTAGNYIWKYYDLETYLIGIMNMNIKEKAA